MRLYQVVSNFVGKREVPESVSVFLSSKYCTIRTMKYMPSRDRHCEPQHRLKIALACHIRMQSSN